MLAAITVTLSAIWASSRFAIFTRENPMRLVMRENVRRHRDQRDLRPRWRSARRRCSRCCAIFETADRVVAGESDRNWLRFQHDDLPWFRRHSRCAGGSPQARVDADDVASGVNAQATPMGTNVQFIFFRNPETGDVRVRVR